MKLVFKTSIRIRVQAVLLLVAMCLIATAQADAYRLYTTASGKKIKWPLSSVSFYVNTTGGPSGSLEAIKAGLKTWTNVPGADFAYVYAGAGSQTPCVKDDSVNNICFTSEGAGDSLAVNNINYDVDTGVVSNTDIIINPKYTYSTNLAANTYDVQNTITHELGHSLVLMDLYASTDSEKTMYAYADVNETKKRDLDPDDMDGIAAMYPKSGTACTYSISPTEKKFTSTGGTGTVSVTTGSDCRWSATSNASWITITSYGDGSGSDTVSFTVAANEGMNSRTGTIIIDESTVTVTQEGASCSYVLSSSSASFAASGGTGTVNVSTLTGCQWTAASNTSWLTINSGANASGSWYVSYSVSQSSEKSQRSGTMTIAGNTFTVTQEGSAGALTVKPTVTIAGNGVTGSINIGTTDKLKLTIALQAGNLAGAGADWWVVALTPFGYYYYLYPDIWVAAPSLDYISPTYQGAAGNVDTVEVLSISGSDLPVGSYVFYFAIDSKQNGSIDYDSLYYSGLTVQVSH